MDVYDFRNDEDPVDITHTELMSTRIAHFLTGFLLGGVVTFIGFIILGMYIG